MTVQDVEKEGPRLKETRALRTAAGEARTIPTGSRASLSMFIRSAEESLKFRNLSFLAQGRMDGPIEKSQLVRLLAPARY